MQVIGDMDLPKKKVVGDMRDWLLSIEWDTTNPKEFRVYHLIILLAKQEEYSPSYMAFLTLRLCSWTVLIVSTPSIPLATGVDSLVHSTVDRSMSRWAVHFNAIVWPMHLIQGYEMQILSFTQVGCPFQCFRSYG